MTRVVLGSASAGRLKVLRQAGIDPHVVVSGVDEDAVIASLGADAPPERVVCALAARERPTMSLSGSPAEVAADCVVIGCDSMLHLDGRLCGKPASVDAAHRQWQAMAGRAGRLYTGHCVVLLRDGQVHRRECESTTTTVHFGTPKPDDLTAYLDSGEPLKVAGGFTLDGLGGWFVDGVTGDPSNVIGLGLPLTRTLFERVGLSIAELWAANPL